MGAQVCKADGSGYDPCECAGTSATTSTSGPTTDPTATTGTSGTTAVDPTTTTGTTGGMACSDPGPEPNEDEQGAVDLGEQPCMDMAQTFNGVLDGDVDVDWFVFHGNWQQCGQVQTDPLVSNTLTASDTVRMCVFVECDQGNNQFMCPMGTMMQMSPDGLPGCCGMGTMEFVLNCQGTGNESANVFVRLDQAPADACVDYSVEYSYNPS